jgi:co-chaperonin GroES (HSP10)
MYEPKFGRVLIERQVNEKTAGGIILVNAKRHASSKGKILALGETAGWTESFDPEGNPKTIQTLKVGQTVIFGRHAGTWLDDDAYDLQGEVTDKAKYFICQDADILAVVKE